MKCRGCRAPMLARPEVAKLLRDAIGEARAIAHGRAGGSEVEGAEHAAAFGWLRASAGHTLAWLEGMCAMCWLRANGAEVRL